MQSARNRQTLRQDTSSIRFVRLDDPLQAFDLLQRNMSGTLPGEGLSEQASLTERGEDHGIDRHSDTDGDHEKQPARLPYTFP